MLMLFAAMGTGTLFAQSLTPQVFASSGTHYTSASAQLSFTIGEPLTSSYTSGTVMVTQGFHQPEQNTSGIEENKPFAFNVYPNPTQDFITIAIKDASIDQYTVDLIDQWGQVIASRKLTGDNQQVDVSALAAGTYHLRLTYLQNKSNSFTIIKTTLH